MIINVELHQAICSTTFSFVSEPVIDTFILTLLEPSSENTLKTVPTLSPLMQAITDEREYVQPSPTYAGIVSCNQSVC